MHLDFIHLGFLKVLYLLIDGFNSKEKCGNVVLWDLSGGK